MALGTKRETIRSKHTLFQEVGIREIEGLIGSNRPGMPSRYLQKMLVSKYIKYKKFLKNTSNFKKIQEILKNT